jgi:hypothetical protein
MFGIQPFVMAKFNKIVYTLVTVPMNWDETTWLGRRLPSLFYPWCISLSAQSHTFIK